MAEIKRKRLAGKKPKGFPLDHGFKLAKNFLKNWPRYLFIFVFLAIFAGIFILQPQSLNDPLQKRFEEVKGRIIKNPTDPELRLDLAQIYKEANDLRKAKEEILVALQYSPDSPVLKKNLEEIKKLEEKPQKIKVEIKKWEGVVSLYPDYRDAWFRLSVLYWQIFDEEKAKFALAKTLELDPNFQPAYNFKNLLK